MKQKFYLRISYSTHVWMAEWNRMVGVVSSLPIWGKFNFCWNVLKPLMSILYRNARFVLKMKTSITLIRTVQLKRRICTIAIYLHSKNFEGGIMYSWKAWFFSGKLNCKSLLCTYGLYETKGVKSVIALIAPWVHFYTDFSKDIEKMTKSINSFQLHKNLYF